MKSTWIMQSKNESCRLNWSRLNVWDALQIFSSLAVTTAGFIFSRILRSWSTKLNEHSCWSACRCLEQNIPSHLHSNPSMPTFVLQTWHRVFFFFFFFGVVSDTPSAAFGSTEGEEQEGGSLLASTDWWVVTSTVEVEDWAEGVTEEVARDDDVVVVSFDCRSR